MVELISTWPIWQTIRVLGMVSYLLLFTGICLGILYSMPFWKGKTKAALYKYHSSATVAGVFCGIFHAMLLVIDLHMPFSWKEILIPFASRNEPLWNGLGTLALYGMLIITFTTDIRTKLKKNVWRAIHFCSYPAFIAALAHGMGAGTDTKRFPIYLMYICTSGIIVLLSVIRICFRRKQNIAHLANRG
ncbi:ferric reductase-like transmembrane domain-containing protein [Brevibacillus massiliensis]|uniref:ferric reductase-like transmembrane domain-containing protein n=1 Tax=Brevibacillus massiliensis TaxID=1118054 RepID=UPI0002E0D85B|nr:ferric reductase-like transmembrane domain-containing protein [Brevibacillus massiliensis]